jgi:hypothetical protein
MILCYRSESGMAKRNFNKPQGHGRTGWRSRNSKKHLNCAPGVSLANERLVLADTPSKSTKFFVLSKFRVMKQIAGDSATYKISLTNRS